MKTRIISILMIGTMLFAGVSGLTASAQYDYKIFDVLNILKYITGMEELNAEQRALYDFYNNDKIDIKNVLEILKYLVGMDSAAGVNPNKPNTPTYVGRGGEKVKGPAPQPNPQNEVVTASQLRQMGWVETALTPALIDDLNKTLKMFNITTKERLRHFISQCAHESGLGRWTSELASGMDYEFREDLGNIFPGDGPKYKGAGYLQMTGRWNYQQFANFIGDQRVMEGVNYVAVNYPWLSAGFWWYSNGLNPLIDGGATVEQVTRKVNGGLNGLAERQRLYELAARIFG